MSVRNAKVRRALVCSYYLPQPDLDSASRRVYHLVDFLLADGWEVSVSAVNSKNLERHGRWLKQRGVAVYPYDQPTLEHLFVKAPLDLAILGFWHVAEPLVNSLRRLSPDTRLIVDSMDLHFVRHARRIFSSTSGPRTLDTSFAFDTVRELNVYGAADLVLTVSDKEAELVNDLTATPNLARMVPDCEDYTASAVGFDERRGMLFLGNFEHPPNADALKYLCEEIVPRLDPALLADHPIRVVGNGLSPALRNWGQGLTGVQMVGWVPTVEPYLERARVSLVPLRYGAGTKRKMIQALSMGTPTVSTTVGIEGLALQHGEHLLVADDARTFAQSITTLLTDARHWRSLAAAGRDHMAAHRGTDVARRLFDAATAAALQCVPKNVLLDTNQTARPRTSMPAEQYSELLQGIRGAVMTHVPADATVAVVTKGDASLLDLDGRTGWHFPMDGSGEYAGFYPSDSAHAIELLKAARMGGAGFLVFPKTQMWWLVHYREFDEYLEDQYRCVVWDEKVCVIFDLRESLSGDEGQQTRAAMAPAVRTQRKRESRPAEGPAISVVIPTFNRAPLLRSSLESLANQGAGSDAFEVIVINDGSTDETAEVCDEFTSRMRIRHSRIEQSGIAAAKNEGVRQAATPLVLFFDDDDVADAELVAEHLRTHDEYPDEQVAVLGYTGWSPSLNVTPVMRFVTDVGHYLFSYDNLSDGQVLDFTYFWGGRSSCKTSLLTRRGLFRPEFRFGSEDIELGYRLSRFGLKVVYRRSAVQHMIRPITYDQFCRRCERQGISQWMFSRMHGDPVVQRWCGVEGAVAKWQAVGASIDEKTALARELEEKVGRFNGSTPEGLLDELWALYWSTFEAFKLKGLVHGMQGGVPS
jgi:GT2 family glycosyltransferase/glycosyltransferase involved in cell wall biosynthesis